MTHSSITSLLLSALAIIGAAACNNSRQDAENTKAAADSSYTLSGRIAGLDSGWVYLLSRETDSVRPRPDSTPVKQGVFTFKGFAARPQFVTMGIRGLMQGNNNIGYQLGFFLDRGLLSVSGSKDSLYKAAITGSRAQDEYLSFPKILSSYEPAQKKLDSIYKKAQKAKNQALLDSVEDAYASIEQRQKESVKQYVLSHPSSYVAAYETMQYYVYNPEPGPLDTIYRALDPAVQNSYYGKKIKSTREIARLLDIDQPAPDFTQPDPQDQPIALASFKGKYVLLDFWASWCGPCRRQSPSLVKAYHRFKPKGFEIFSVSLDDNKKDWLEAIKKDQLAWTHVSDLKSWENEAAQLYGVVAIPMNFLLDREGRIVAKGLRGGQLEKKLAELLQ